MMPSSRCANLFNVAATAGAATATVPGAFCDEHEVCRRRVDSQENMCAPEAITRSRNPAKEMSFPTSVTLGEQPSRFISRILQATQGRV